MHYHSLFVSDIHLGTKACQIQYLLKFIHNNTFENVYLLGDIIDIYALSHNWYWSKDHNTFIQKILKMSRKGTYIIMIPGNHDAILRDWIKDNSPFFFGDIIIAENHIYTSIKGRRFLLTHGDEYDGAIRSLGWLYWVGDRAYDLALKLNTIYSKIRKLFGLNYWSLSKYLKSKVKQAVAVFSRFDELVLRTCLAGSYDGIIYGHTHHPCIKIIKTKLVMNTGDMVESCSCIVETIQGEFKIIELTKDQV